MEPYKFDYYNFLIVNLIIFNNNFYNKLLLKKNRIKKILKAKYFFLVIKSYKDCFKLS